MNNSAAEWHGLNFGSSFGNSKEFEGRNASTLTGRSKCNNCEVNRTTIKKQINLVINQDKQLQDRHKIQRDNKKALIVLKKKLDDTVKFTEDLRKEKTNGKFYLQVQKDLLVAET